jgi:hypothetical protein
MSNVLQPSVADVLQEEDTSAVTVPVCITDQKTPIRTQALPRKGGATLTKPITATSQRVLRADHRRALARLSCATAIYVAFSQTAAQDPSTMALCLAGVPVSCEADTDIYVRTVTGTDNLGIMTFLWAEG